MKNLRKYRVRLRLVARTDIELEVEEYTRKAANQVALAKAVREISEGEAMPHWIVVPDATRQIKGD